MKFVFALALVALCVIYMHARPNVIKRGADENKRHGHGPGNHGDVGRNGNGVKADDDPDALAGQLNGMKDTQRKKRAATNVKTVHRWPKDADGKVNIAYRFEPKKFANEEKCKGGVCKALSEIVEEAAQEWNDKAGINIYHDKSATAERFITVHDGQGCWSWVGYQSGKNEINLENSVCFTHGVVLHEMGHALGLIHEAKRNDRDKYIDVESYNVDNSFLDQFTIDSGAEGIQSSILHGAGKEYDFCGIMHYSPESFSKNGEPTIKVKGENKEEVTPCLGSQIGLSLRDGIGVAELYGTIGNEELQREKDCQYGAYALKDREDCVCSNLLEGPKCDKPKKIGPGDCGKQTFKLKDNGVDEFTTPKFKEGKEYPNNQECTWVATCPDDNAICIGFPEGYTVEEPSSSGTCFFDWISIFSDVYDTLKGRRYCGKNGEGWYHVLPSHFAAVVFKSDDAYPADGFDGVFACIPSEDGKPIQELDPTLALELDHKCLEKIKEAVDSKTKAIDYENYLGENYDPKNDYKNDQDENYSMFYYYYYYY